MEGTKIKHAKSLFMQLSVMRRELWTLRDNDEVIECGEDECPCALFDLALDRIDELTRDLYDRYMEQADAKKEAEDIKFIDSMLDFADIEH